MSGTEDKTKGKIDELKGKAKEGIGEVTNDEKLKEEGAADQAKGKAQQAVGGLKDAADDAKDAVKKVFRKDDN